MLIDRKNVIVKLKESKTLTVKLAGAIALSSTVGTGAYVGLKETVTLDLDGKKEVISTHADTVGEFLKEQNIQIDGDDIVLPGTKTEIKDDLKVKVVFAKSVQFTLDGKKKVVASPAKDVEAFLKQQGVVLTSNDDVTPSLDTPLSKGLDIVVNKAFQVPTNIGGKEQTIWSTSITVADFLKKQGVTLNELDKVSPSLDTVIQTGDKVNVVRVEKISNVIEKEIPFGIIKREDKSMLRGEEEVVSEGQKGKKKETYVVIKENGKEISRKLTSSEVIKEAVSKEIVFGTKKPASTTTGTTTTTTAKPAMSGREYIVEATAFTPWCDGCNGTTATGINIGANPYMKLIAVDPRVIPLGSKVWVEGYGVAIAGDTGGAIKGYKIDILVPNDKAAYNWGRKKVRIKVLD
ncbi:MAG: ubiquitin-like domain-containing protein [Bacillaceae bacterium]